MMNEPQESLILSSLRAFLRSVFSMTGIAVGMIPLILLLGALFDSDGVDLPSETSYRVIAGVDGTRKTLDKEGPVVLKIEIKGMIGGESLDAEKIRLILQESREGVFAQDRVKGLLLYINTPGGTVFDADKIYRYIKEYKERYQIPVFAYVDGLCASGGMYVASAADQIYASDVSLVGSVGVILNSFINVSKVLDQWGIEARTVSSGKEKDTMNPLRPWAEAEEQQFQVLANDMYERFVSIVSSNRPSLSAEELVNVHGARVYPASKAKEFGFIDESGQSESSTLDALHLAMGFDPRATQVVEFETQTWLRGLFQGESPLQSGQMEHHFHISGLPPQLPGPFLYLYQPGH